MLGHTQAVTSARAHRTAPIFWHQDASLVSSFPRGRVIGKRVKIAAELRATFAVTALNWPDAGLQSPARLDFIMAMLGSIRRQLTPIHPEGYIFIAGFALATFVLGSFFGSLFWIGTIATVWCAYFFRDPVRLTPLDENLVISPADGVVSSVGYFAPPPELGLGAEPMQRVSIFMSVFDCHVNRAPVAGRVTKIAYRPGLFVNADLAKASENNERNGLVIEAGGGRFGVVQIAGFVARRIVCFVRQGEVIGAGDRFGLIRFGSRVDVYMPDAARPMVATGSKAVGGETTLAELRSNAPRRNFKSG
jgi:phosphatidylserine decarboxylase